MAAARSSRVGAGAVLVIVLALGALVLIRSQHMGPQIGSGCLVRSDGVEIPLTTDQAGIAATIAGVARQRSMPVRAVTIAYAAALQESDLADLPYGDRDSVGVFQQRPSQGWGTRKQLLDPIYATSRFFAALAAVPGYQHLHIYQAAQDVQHSADGSAYGQYAPEGSAMATGFTGYQPRAVWCWYGSGLPGRTDLAAATRKLAATFGSLPVGHVGDPAIQVRVSRQELGWAVASWLVTHAREYAIRSIRYQGYLWTAAHGAQGWVRDTKPPVGMAVRLSVAFG